MRRREGAVEPQDFVLKMQSPMELMKGSQQIAQVSPETIRQQIERTSTRLSDLQDSLSKYNPSKVGDASQKQLHKHLQDISDSLKASNIIVGAEAKDLHPPKKPLNMVNSTINLLASANNELLTMGQGFDKGMEDVSIGKMLRMQYHLYRIQRSVELSTAIIGKTASSLNSLFNTQL